MSLRRLAEHIQTHGRGEDTVLVHMTPREVAGLQRIAEDNGGSLSINPHTGLPEAGFLSDILPIIAGVGMSFIPGVGPGLAALTVGAGKGLYEGIKSGDAGKGLLSGLTAGLGAYGGAGLTQGLTKLGTAGLAAEANAARSAASAVPNSAFNTGNSFLNPLAAQSANAANVSTAALTPMQSMQAAGRGLGIAAQNPGQYVDALGGGFNTAKFGAATMAPFLDNSQQGVNIRPTPTNPASQTRLSNDFFQRPMYSGEPNALQYRQGFAGGGFVNGAGDGMSDSVPARMNNGGEVRLASEEFVVPADVVSGLGNGSSEAGAGRLYDMLARVRQARTGSTQQAPAIDPSMVMPA